MFAWLKELASSIAGKSTSSTPPDDVPAHGTQDDAAGAAPGEALADRSEGPHAPTTPDDPLVTVEVDED